MPALNDAIPQLPMTPPDSVQGTPNPRKSWKSAINLALHVISTERAGLAHLEYFYQNDPCAQQALSQAINLLASTSENGGKIVITGVGKSGKIGQKIEATFKSLGVDSTFLYPTDALHGDLGTIKPNDSILMISYSGTTSELLALLPHISPKNPLIAMTSHTQPSTCPLLTNRDNGLLLPAPIHEPEKASFSISAPTTSTTVALALGDALALAVAQKLHVAVGKCSAEIFHSNHPGGAIGAAVNTNAKVAGPVLMSTIAVPVKDAHFATQKKGRGRLTSLDIMQAAVRSPCGWVRISPIHIIAPRRIQQLQDMTEIIDTRHPAVIEKQDWISVLGSCAVDEVKQWILSMRKESRGRTFLHKRTVLGIVDDNNEVSAVVEIEDVVGELPEECPAMR